MEWEKQKVDKGDPGFRILLVDEETNILESYSDVLKRWGYEVATASNASEAMRLIEKESFDLVITALRMPDKSGIEIIRIVKEKSPATPVIVLTETPSVQTAVQAMKEGASDYFARPFAVQEIQQRVKEAVGFGLRRRARRGILVTLSEKAEELVDILSTDSRKMAIADRKVRELRQGLRRIDTEVAEISQLLKKLNGWESL